MPRVPTTIDGFMNFLATHASLWDTQHAALGISASQSAAFKVLAGTAQTNYTNQLTQQELTKSATNKQQGTTRDAREMAADLIRSIGAYAQQQANPDSVYQLAQIDPPQPAQPAAPPGIPTDFTAQLQPSGAVTLKWKAVDVSGRGGVVWTVKRRTGSTGSFMFLGAVGKRAFTDNSLPSGSPSVQYVVQGQRGDAVGAASSPYIVQFGVGGGGGMTISAQFSEPAKSRKKAA